MNRVGIVSVVIACFGIAGYSYYPLHATEPITQSSKNVAIIFDLGGVLIQTNKRSALWQLGPRTVFSYFIRNRSISRMHEQFYAALNRIDHTQGNQYGAKDPDGNDLPHIIAEWLKGNQPNAQIMITIEREIKNHPEWFSTKQEQQLVTSIANLILKPENFIQACQTIPEMIHLVRQCKQKGYQLYILSNWDAESFELLSKKYPDLFNLFDNVIISGHVHKIKPDPEMFALVTKNIPANSCIFIDDQPENIEAAQRAGMHGILATPKRALLSKTPDVQKIKTELMRLEPLCGAPYAEGTNLRLTCPP